MLRFAVTVLTSQCNITLTRSEMRARRLDRVAPGWSRVRIAAVFLIAAVIVAVTPRLLSVALPPDPLRNFITYAAAKPVPALGFKDGDGQVRSLTDFNGKVVVLNLWAAWCVPCRKEMPALDRLQTSLGGWNFAVVPLSIDRGGRETVAKFYAEIGIRELPIYTDTSGEALGALGAVGLPTTLVLDRAGQEIARIVGPAEWDAPEVVEFLKAMIAKQAAAVLNPVSGLVDKSALLDRRLTQH